MTDHDPMPQPIGRPQGGMKSDAGRAAYWRMQHESAIGALADLIAEHTEQRAAVAEEIAQAISDEHDAHKAIFGKHPSIEESWYLDGLDRAEDIARQHGVLLSE